MAQWALPLESLYVLGNLPRKVAQLRVWGLRSRSRFEETRVVVVGVAVPRGGGGGGGGGVEECIIGWLWKL